MAKVEGGKSDISTYQLTNNHISYPGIYSGNMYINYMDLNSGVAGFSQKDYQLKRHVHFLLK